MRFLRRALRHLKNVKYASIRFFSIIEQNTVPGASK